MNNTAKTIQHLVTLLDQRESDILALLQTYESFHTAQFELNMARQTLEQFDRQQPFLLNAVPQKTLAVFFPINLPLYSLVLYALSPSPFFEKVFLRVPLSAIPVVEKLIQVLELSALGIELVNESRSFFVQNYASNAEVVIFTGKAENADKVQQQCPRSLFFFNGYGVNPVIVASDADLSLLVPQLVTIRTFNSGQDCMAPDPILVHDSVIDDLRQSLITSLAECSVGQYADRKVKIGPLTEQASFDSAVQFLQQEQKHIVFGGETLPECKTVFPTVIQKKLSELEKITEFFAPIFLLVSYSSENELQEFFSSPQYRPYQMYESVFGTLPTEIFGQQLLHNQTTTDIDDGNAVFGGYGEKVNGIVFKIFSIHRPFLLNQELSQWRSSKKTYLHHLRDHTQKQPSLSDPSQQWT